MANKPDVTDIQWASDDVIDLITSVNNKVEPLTIKKTNGWDRLEKPPREYDNYLKNQYYQWFLFLEQFFYYYTGQTTNATETEIFLNGISNNRLNINTNEMITFEVIINAILSNASQSKSWKIKNDIIRSAGSPYTLIQEKEILNINNWDITTAVYSQEFDVSARETVPQGVFFRQSDGLKMYTIGSGGDTVDEYNLSTAWDVTTAVYSQEFSVAGQDNDPRGVFFRQSDGLKMYVVGNQNDKIYEYNLSTAWDVTTAVYSQEFSVAAKDTNPTDVFFRQDGLKMYMSGATGGNVYEYNLSTAWDVTTAVYSQEFSVSTQDITPTGLFFKLDGLAFYIMGNNTDKIYEYNLSTAWDVTTAVYSQEFDISSKETNPTGVFFRQDGSKIYTIGIDGTSVDEYDLFLSWDVNLEADITNNALVPKVVGEASKTINWKIKLETLIN